MLKMLLSVILLNLLLQALLQLLHLLLHLLLRSKLVLKLIKLLLKRHLPLIDLPLQLMQLVICAFLLLTPFFLDCFLHSVHFCLACLQLFLAPSVLLQALLLLFFSLCFILTSPFVLGAALSLHLLAKDLYFFLAFLIHGFHGDHALLRFSSAFELGLELFEAARLAVLLFTQF